MRYKIIFCLLLALSISGCKKADNGPVSSGSIIGSWKFIAGYNTTIAGVTRYPADAASPIIWKFHGTVFTKTTSGKTTLSGTYTLVDRYEYYPGYFADKVLKINNTATGIYQINRGQPDTLWISSINHGPDYGSGNAYLRVK